MRRSGGVPSALLAAVLFGVSAPFAKLLLRTETPQLLAGLLYAGSGVGLLAVWLARRTRDTTNEAPLTKADAPWLAGAIAAGGVMGPLLLMMGLSRTPASAASLMFLFPLSVEWLVVVRFVQGLGFAAAEIEIGQPDRDAGGDKQEAADAEIQPEVHVVMRVPGGRGGFVGRGGRGFGAVIVGLAHGLD